MHYRTVQCIITTAIAARLSPWDYTDTEYWSAFGELKRYASSTADHATAAKPREQAPQSVQWCTLKQMSFDRTKMSFDRTKMSFDRTKMSFDRELKDAA